MGARQMVTTLRQDYSLKVPEYVTFIVHLVICIFDINCRATVAKFLKQTEPKAVEHQKARRFRRKRFWSAGVMDILTIDQHDMWKRFGLWLHIGLDPYPDRIAWLKVWWCNCNPRLIASYYLEARRKVGGMLVVTVSAQYPPLTSLYNQVYLLSCRVTIEQKTTVSRTAILSPATAWIPPWSVHYNIAGVLRSQTSSLKLPGLCCDANSPLASKIILILDIIMGYIILMTRLKSKIISCGFL